MTLIVCPRCKRIVAVQPGNTDFIHTCNSGNPTLDNEDIVDITGNGWNFKGVTNEANIQASVRGVDIEEVTRRGVKKSTHLTRQHEEFIKIEK